MIQFDGVRKRFDALQVLDGVDLAIATGRVTAIVGPNSAGKTTLIKSLLGLTRIDAGVIRVGGAPVDRAGRYREQIGYMPQIARFPENLRASDLFEMMRHLRGHSARDEELIERLALREHLEKPLRVLSGGTRQKINAALAFLFAPKLLVLDEPTAGLDPVASSIVKDKILAERANGRTFILTSHVMSELEELADDIAFLVEGRIRFAGSIHDLKKLTRQLSLERAIAHVMEQRGASGAAA
jgi:Cu-processing system ATP-binding protein